MQTLGSQDLITISGWLYHLVGIIDSQDTSNEAGGAEEHLTGLAGSQGSDQRAHRTSKRHIQSSESEDSPSPSKRVLKKARSGAKSDADVGKKVWGKEISPEAQGQVTGKCDCIYAF